CGLARTMTIFREMLAQTFGERVYMGLSHNALMRTARGYRRQSRGDCRPSQFDLEQMIERLCLCCVEQNLPFVFMRLVGFARSKEALHERDLRGRKIRRIEETLDLMAVRFGFFP